MENLSDAGIRVRQGKSPKALGEKFEEFSDYAICVAKNGNALSLKLEFFFCKERRKGVLLAICVLVSKEFRISRQSMSGRRPSRSDA